MSRLIFVAVLFLCCLNDVKLANTNEGNSCYSYAGGMVYPQEFRDPEKSNHKLQWTKAMSEYKVTFVIRSNLLFTLAVSQPAPQWEGTAVVNGEFTELKLSDYRGKYVVFFFYPLDLYVFFNARSF